MINIAATCHATHALGPGLRSVVWVQGCPFRCLGCISPEWIPDRVSRLVSPRQLADELLSDPLVEGITISGGEPMVQASGLSETINIIKKVRDVSILCFTGYSYEDLIRQPPNPSVSVLLSQIDVLIDGPYVAGLNDNKGLRGSANQRIIYLTSRLSAHFLEEAPRRLEIEVQDGQAFLVGIPMKGMGVAFSNAIISLEEKSYRMVAHERT